MEPDRPSTGSSVEATASREAAADAELVSTIIPVHNRASLLRQAVASVQAQSHRPIEILIVNDGSDDDTGAVAEQLAADSSVPIRVIHQPNAGPGSARQRGLEASRGRYIQFLDSDDLLLPGKFSAQVAALREQPACQICYGPSFEENHGLQPVGRQGPMRGTGEPRASLFPLLLVERWWTTSSPLYRRDLLERIGPWKDWINEEDWEYDARAAAAGAPLAWVGDAVSVRRIHLAEGHLSDDGCEDPRKLRDRAKARASIFRSALAVGIPLRAPEMRHFARSAFLLCRQCGEADVPDAAAALFELTWRASTPLRRLSPDLLLYRLLAALIGWQRAARLSRELRRRLAWRAG
jgi:glycosyltransferase involved in cell wall biosynthesis